MTIKNKQKMLNESEFLMKSKLRFTASCAERLRNRQKVLPQTAAAIQTVLKAAQDAK